MRWGRAGLVIGRCGWLVILVAVLAVGCARMKLSQADSAIEAGHYQEALSLLDEVVAGGTSDPAVYANRANCHSSLGNLEGALADYEQAMALLEVTQGSRDTKAFAIMYYNRGYAYQRAGKWAEAVPDYEKTLALDPDYPDVSNSLAWILATSPEAELRDPPRAVTIATAACEQTEWQSAEDLDTLAAACAAAGDFAAAVEHQRTVVEMLAGTEYLSDAEQRLSLYADRIPYVDATGQPSP